MSSPTRISSRSFIVYIIHKRPTGNLTQTLCGTKFKLYADDGKLIVELRTDRDNDDMQSDMNKIVKWCESWSME